jgi:Ribbon-helix-helix protein, copG family
VSPETRHYTHSMSKRLQVLIPDQEMADIQRLAKRERVPVSEWVRRVLREARARRPNIDPETKLKALRRAAEYSFPTADVNEMLSEIERGYKG